MPPLPLRHPMRVCLGGTFDRFHVGHERLLQRAIDVAGPQGHLFVGLVSDAFGQGKRERTIRPYDERHDTLATWFERHAGDTTVVINALDDAFGPSASGDYDVLVTSVETAGTGARINAARGEKGLSPLRVDVVPFVLGPDLLPISGTRIAAGLIDREGRRLRPLKVAVGSANPVKVEAVRHAFTTFLPGVDLEVTGHAVESGVPEQPYDHQTAEGAVNRAEAALSTGPPPGAEYAVGIEAGLVQDPFCGGWLDVQHCVVLDASGHRTHGHGPGFHYPAAVEGDLANGATVGAALGALSDDPDIGRGQGAVGWLTEGRLDRTRLTSQAVEAALIPRVRRALYDIGKADRTGPHELPKSSR